MSAKPRIPTSGYHCRSNIITANDAFFTKSIGTLSQFCNLSTLQLPWANLGPWGRWRQPLLRGSTDTCSSGKVGTISVAILATIYPMFIVAVLSISNFIYNKNLNSICKAAYSDRTTITSWWPNHDCALLLRLLVTSKLTRGLSAIQGVMSRSRTALKCSNPIIDFTG